MNTGLMNLETKAPDGSMPKDYINKQLQLRIYGRGIRDGVDRTENGTTDIGTALLVAL